MRSEAGEKYEQASTQLADLKHKKEVTKNVVEEAQQRNDEIKEQLKSNENYRQISHLEERLSDIIEETKKATTTLDQLQKVHSSFFAPKGKLKPNKNSTFIFFRNITTMMLYLKQKKNSINYLNF